VVGLPLEGGLCNFQTAHHSSLDDDYLFREAGAGVLIAFEPFPIVLGIWCGRAVADWVMGAGM
jgi:hypothetical protein